MKTLNQYFFAIFCLILILGCKKENNPTPTDRTLPQGFIVYDDFNIFNSVIIQSNGEIVISGAFQEERGLGLLKLNTELNEIWSRSYFDINFLTSGKVEKQKNDGLIITGILNLRPSIASLNKDGEEQWVYRNLETTGLIDEFYAIQTMDNGILAVGSVADSGFSAIVFKYNNIGEEQWREFYNGENFSLEGFNPIELNNGDIIIPSSKLVPPQKSLAFLRINSEGEKLWVRDTEIQISLSTFCPHKTIKTVDNNLLSALNTPRDDFSLSSPLKVIIAKTELNGWTAWTKEISIGRTNTATSILELTTGEIMLLGSLSEENENLKVVLIKMDSQGNEIWRQTYSTEQDFRGRDLIETTEGFLIVGALSDIDDVFNSTATILKVDKEGNPL